MDVREKLIDLKPCPFCGGEACVKTSTTQTIPSHPMAWVYCKKNARAHQQVLMIVKETALFCLMQSMHGTAVPERRTSMRLCDLDEIKICVDRQYENCHGYSGSKKAIYREAILAVKSILHSAKSIDAVEVVRCRECKYWGDEDGELQRSDGVLFAWMPMPAQPKGE